MKRERMLQVAVGLLYVALIYPLSRIKANFSDAQEELSYGSNPFGRTSIFLLVLFSGCGILSASNLGGLTPAMIQTSTGGHDGLQSPRFAQ